MRRIGMAVVALMSVSAPLAGQRGALREVHRGGDGRFGIEVVIAEPLGEFRRTGSHAGGLAIHGVTRANPLGVRIDGGWMVYDAADGGSGVTMTSQIGSLMIGPQVTLGQGPMRIYGFLTGGGSVFWSDVNFQDGCGCSSSDFIDGDLTFARAAGAGVLLSLSQKLSIDVGVRELRHDRVSYFPSGGLVDNGDGTFSGEKVETPVLQRVWQVGVSFSLR